MNEQTYKFNFYRAAKFVRSVRAYSVPDAVAMIPEFTDAKIHSPWTSAHQWIGLEALELIIEIEATKPVETNCPAEAPCAALGQGAGHHRLHWPGRRAYGLTYTLNARMIAIND